MECSKRADVKNTNQAALGMGTLPALHFQASGNCPTWTSGFLLATTLSANRSHTGPTFLLAIDDIVRLLRNICVHYIIRSSYRPCAPGLTNDNTRKQAEWYHFFVAGGESGSEKLWGLPHWESRHWNPSLAAK